MLNKLAGILSFILFTCLTGCNLPNSTLPTPDLVASQVAALLTNTPAIEINTPITEIEIPTITILPSTETPKPTDTEIPTPQPSLSPSPITLDIPTGSPTWIDTFADGTRFGITSAGYDDGQTKIVVSGNSFVMTSITASGWRGWRLTSQKPNNYYLQANFQTSGCSGSDQYGLVVQAPDYESGNGLYFGVTCDGRYAFQKWSDGTLSNLQSWANDSNIHSGSDQTNMLGILKSGNHYSLYVNNGLITKLEDENFSSPGFFGPFIAGVNTPNFTVELLEISYWLIP